MLKTFGLDWKVALTLVYATGALIVARHFGRFERPTGIAWSIAIFFLIPVFLQAAQSLGVFKMLADFALPH